MPPDVNCARSSAELIPLWTTVVIMERVLAVMILVLLIDFLVLVGEEMMGRYPNLPYRCRGNNAAGRELCADFCGIDTPARYSAV